MPYSQRKGHLRRRVAGFACDLRDDFHQLQVVDEILAREARIAASKVAAVEILDILERARQESAAQRAIGDHAGYEGPSQFSREYRRRRAWRSRLVMGLEARRTSSRGYSD
jgi:hypothetical protein